MLICMDVWIKLLAIVLFSSESEFYRIRVEFTELCFTILP